MARSFTAANRLGFPSLPTSAIYAVHVRFRTSKTPGNPMVLWARWNSSSRNGAGIYIFASGNIGFEGYNASGSVMSGNLAGPWNDGNWHSATLNVNGNNGQPSQLFIDGTGLTPSNASAAFGVQNNITAPWNGLSFWDTLVGDMADLALWDGVTLAADEAVGMARGFSPSLIRRESLTLYVPWVQTDRDLCGATTGVPVGTPGVAAHARVLGSPA